MVQGWLHWWSVNNPDRPNNDWTIFGLMNNGQYMTENCAVRSSSPRFVRVSRVACVPMAFVCTATHIIARARTAVPPNNAAA